jgi:hypothetical protein
VGIPVQLLNFQEKLSFQLIYLLEFNVVKDIGDENVNIDKSHPSIIKIEENKTDDTELSFKPVTEEYVNKQISKLNIVSSVLFSSIFIILG